MAAQVNATVFDTEVATKDKPFTAAAGVGTSPEFEILTLISSVVANVVLVASVSIIAFNIAAILVYVIIERIKIEKTNFIVF